MRRKHSGWRWAPWMLALGLAACAPAWAGGDGERAAVSTSRTVAAASIPAALKQAVSRAAPADVPAGASSVLDFVRDAAVSSQEQDAIMRQLAGQPGGGASLEHAVRSGRLMGRFDDLLAGYGYSPRNLGDVLAAHLVIAWEIANGKDSTRQPAGQRAVRRQLAQPLASVPGVARMSDAAKQAQAERTAYMTMIWAAAYQELKDGRDPDQLRSLQDSVRARFRDTGVDLQRLDLGAGGLVLR
ncbi:MAG TPA: DUF6683 family protein [Luteimonas sp.]|nr:DUF6683 family protein [Luteimonas sp.]